VITLRCTKRLLDRMKTSPNAELPSPSSRLGDWYAHTFIIRRTHDVLAVSERSLLPVVIPAAPIKTLVSRFLDGACDVMRAIGVHEDQLTGERRAMDEVTIGRTENRQVLGTINDFGRMSTWKATHALARPFAWRRRRADRSRWRALASGPSTCSARRRTSAWSSRRVHAAASSRSAFECATFPRIRSAALAACAAALTINLESERIFLAQLSM